MKESSKKELFEKILRVWPDLSQKKKRVADFILEDYKRIFLMTAKEIAQQCHVSEPTITRFVMDLGFSGYSDFMRYIKGLLHIELTAVDRMAKASKKFSGSTTLETYYQNTAINLGNMMNSVSEKELKDIAQMVYSANSVIVAEFGHLFRLPSKKNKRWGFDRHGFQRRDIGPHRSPRSIHLVVRHCLSEISKQGN